MRKLNVALLSVLIVLLFSINAMAEKPLTPKSLKGAKVVSTEWVKSNFGKVNIYDVRKKAEYVEARIKGAISIPYKERSEKSADFDSSVDKLDISKFPSDKNAVIVVHCNGPRCWKSYKASVLLVRAGYKNVKWYREGIPEWKAKGNPVE